MTIHKYRYDFPLTLPAGRARVFRALTEEAALRRWLAEHVEVDAREGGVYRFWGRHTLGAPGGAAARQRITRFEPDAVLAFSWRLLERDSEVTLTLRDHKADEQSTEAPVEDSEAGPGTRLSVEHHFESLPDIVRAAEMIDDMWRVHTGSLLEYIMGKEKIYRADFSDPEPRVRCELLIEAPPAIVFQVLTTPEYISQWFPAPAPMVDLRVGGSYGFGFSYEQDGKIVTPPPCTILEYEPDHRLAITWPDWRGDSDVLDQKVSWTLEDLGGRTRLVLVHDGFTRPVDVSDYPFGWGHFLREISRVAERVKARS